MIKTGKYWLVVLVAFFAACSYQFPEIVEPTQEDLGAINTEKIVAIGDGFLGGAMDGAFYTEGQENSVAAIIVGQLNKLIETEFNQAEISAENGYNFYMSNETDIYGKWFLQFSGYDSETPTRELSQGNPINNFLGDKSALNDLTFPLFKTKHLYGVNPADKAYPYFSRIFDTSKDEKLQIINKSPSLVLLWLGINDYLEYAMNGASNEEMFSQLSETRGHFQSLVTWLLSETDAKIIIGNLIPINDLPYFYLNQYNFIRLDNAKKGAAQSRYNNYNSAVAKYNVGKPMSEWRPMITFEDNGSTLYPQRVVVEDKTLVDASYADGTPLEKYRQLNENEMALFSITPQLVANGYGSSIPVSDNYYLSEKQIEKINEFVATFNQGLVSMVQNWDPERLVLVDIKSEIAKIAQTGRIDSWGFYESEEFVFFDGVPVEAGIDKYSIYSLDAVHFNQRGNAFIANEFIKVLNQKFGADIPGVNINNYVGNQYNFAF